jgi:hypothetical protein
MKIAIISFDYWNYDCHIANKLKEKGIDATHINMGAYRYKNFSEKAYNAFSKIFLNKNIKHVKRQEHVLEYLDKIGPQDQILILNPHTLDYQTIEKIKPYTERLITYLYDNLSRYPVEDKLSLFDKVYSFEDKDVLNHGFEKITNYNYLSSTPQPSLRTELDIFYITSFDKRRIKILKKIVAKLTQLHIKSKIVIVGKQVWKEKLNHYISNNSSFNEVLLLKKPIGIDEVLNEYANSNVTLDLIRDGQEGLSFRVFEAMALEKKIITDNPSIVHYDFYDPQNILYLDKNLSNLDASFFQSSYKSLPREVFKKYTLDNWVETLFSLKFGKGN